MGGESASSREGGGSKRGALLAILDQGLFMVGNSCLLLGMARWISRESFGLYSNYYILLVLASNLQVSFLLEPTVVLGAGQSAAVQHRYLQATWRLCRRTSIWASLILPSLLLPLLWPLRAKLGFSGIAGFWFGMGVATFGMLELFAVRRALYCAWKVGASARMALFFVLGLILGLTLLVGLNAISLVNCLLLQGTLGLVVVKVLGEPALAFGAWEPGNPYPFSEHLQYGGVVFSSFLLGWLGNLYFPVLSFSRGLESAGILRSALNFIYPSVMMNQALGQYFLPIWANLPSPGARRAALYRSLAGWAIFGALMWGLLAIAPTFLIRLVYRETYVGAAWMLPYLGVLPLLDGMTYFLSLSLRASNRPKLVLGGTGIMASCVLIVGLPLSLYKGPPGAVAGLVVTSFLYFLGMTFMARRFREAS